MFLHRPIPISWSILRQSPNFLVSVHVYRTILVPKPAHHAREHDFMLSSMIKSCRARRPPQPLPVLHFRTILFRPSGTSPGNTFASSGRSAVTCRASTRYCTDRLAQWPDFWDWFWLILVNLHHNTSEYNPDFGQNSKNTRYPVFCALDLSHSLNPFRIKNILPWF